VHSLQEDIAELDANLAHYRGELETLARSYDLLRDEVRVLLKSRRWRLGNFLLSLPGRFVGKPPETLADTLLAKAGSTAETLTGRQRRDSVRKRHRESPASDTSIRDTRRRTLEVSPSSETEMVDITEPLQNAIDDARPGRRVISIPPGRYLVRTVRLVSDTAIQGTDDGETVLRLAPNANGHMFTNAGHGRGNRDLELRNLTLEGNGLVQQRSPGDESYNFCSIVYFNAVDGVRLIDIKASDAKQAAAHFTLCDDVVVDGLRGERIGWSGVSTSGTDRIVVTNTRIVDSGRDGVHSAIHLDGGNAAFVECTVRTCTGYGVMLDSEFSPLSGAVVTADIADCRTGISIGGYRNNELTHVLVRDSLVENNETGIAVSNAKHVFVDGVAIRGNTGAGLTFDEGRLCADVVVTNTRFENNGQELAGDDRIAGASLLNNHPPEINKPVRTRGAWASIQANTGTCTVCGTESHFIHVGGPARESYRCQRCQASLRERGQARAIVELYGEGIQNLEALCRQPSFRSLAVFEPAIAGPFSRYFRQLPNYVQSYQWEGLAPGETRNGVASQDLLALTFPDASFDLVITSDVMEHVRRPYAAFEEIRRVLKPGGRHVFTVPIGNPLPEETVFRVDTTTDADVALLPPRYHVAGDGGRSLVYTEFGRDMLAALRDVGFETQVSDDVGVPTGPGSPTFISTKTG